jgi:hypothetical protein
MGDFSTQTIFNFEQNQIKGTENKSITTENQVEKIKNKKRF